MKLFFCNDGTSSLSHEVRTLQSKLAVNVRRNFAVHVEDNIGVESIDDVSRQVVSTVLTSKALMSLCKHHDLTSGSMLYAYDMPLFGYGDMLLVGDGEIADVCRTLLKSAYAAARFDYVFLFPGSPCLDVLKSNGVVQDGFGVCHVQDWKQVLEILEIEVWNGI